MCVKQTSLESYYDLNATGELGKRQQEVIKAFETHGDHTDLEIADRMNRVDPNQVRPRRNELVKIGVVEEKERRLCEISGRKAIVWGLVGKERKG